MTNKIDEAAYSLDNCIGPESSDIFSLPKPKESWYENLNAELPERIIWTSTFGFADVDKEIKEKCEEAISKIESAGCEVIRDEEIWKEDPVSSWQFSGLGQEEGLKDISEELQTGKELMRIFDRKLNGVWIILVLQIMQLLSILSLIHI